MDTVDKDINVDKGLIRQANYLKKAKEVHGDIYTYLEVPTNWKTDGKPSRIKYTCNTCGEYMDQVLTRHLHEKNGCRKCKKPRGGFGRVTQVTFDKDGNKIDTPATLYIAKMTPKDGTPEYLKVGVTTQKLSKRYMNLRFHSKANIETVAAVEGPYYHLHCLERYILTHATKHETSFFYWGCNEAISLGTDYDSIINEFGDKL